MYKNEVTELLQVDHPIIQAPMAGGVTTSELVAAVSNNGCLGMIGAGYMTPVQIRKQIREVKELTSNNFGVNLFVPNEFHTSTDKINVSNRLLHPIREQFNLPEQSFEPPKYINALETFNEQIKVIMEERPPVCSFTFGLPPKEVITALKKHHIILLGTATTVREAMEAEKIGMDLVVVQGSEAGGHRGNFINVLDEGLIGLMSLIPQAADQVKIPVIAAGGIMDGRGLMAAICLGAKGVQMGTAFLTCKESGAHQVHKEAILNSNEDQTVLTRAFSGKWARGIANQFVSDMQAHETWFPDYPIQNTLTQDIRKASALHNNREFMSLWSGQSPRLAKDQSVGTLIQNIIAEAVKIGHVTF